jgi:hypothetical protein
MSIEVTLIVLAVTVFLLVGSIYMDRRPRELGQVDLIPYKGVTLVTTIILVVLLAHLIALWTGTPITGRLSKF